MQYSEYFTASNAFSRTPLSSSLGEVIRFRYTATARRSLPHFSRLRRS